MKVLAILLGPSGVGLLSIFSSLQEMVTGVAGLGVGSSGVREIASSRGEKTKLSRVWRVLIIAHWVQGILGLVVVWLLRIPISMWLFGDLSRATEIGLVGIAVLLSLLATAHTVLLQGMHQIGDLGRVSVAGALGATSVGLFAVWIWDEAGLIWFLLFQPLTMLLVAIYYTRRLPKLAYDKLTLLEIWQVWKPIARLGVAFMLGGLATTATLLIVRGRIAQELGIDAAGHFAAAWGISMTYVGFLLAAMAADYYPRLAAVIHDRPTAVGLMNDQAQIGLAIGGPVLLLLIGCAPWVIRTLYSGAFEPAVALVQWQALGNVFKLAGWAIGFSMAASGRGWTFLLTQVNFNIWFLVMLWPSLGLFGIVSAGPAFALAYFIHFALVNMLVRHAHGFRWQPLSLALLALHAALGAALLALALSDPLGAVLVAPLLALATGLLGLRVVLVKIGPEGRFATRLTRFYTAIGWPIRRNT